MSTSNATRTMNQAIIGATVRAVAGQNADPRVLLPTAKRESAFAHRVDAKHPADVEGAKRVFARVKDTTYKNNRWRNRPELWATSRGLFQLMVPYHVTKLGADWAPTVLWHPIAATFAAARLVNRLVASGAKNMCQVRSGWAGGTKFIANDPDFERRCQSLQNRLKSMGYPTDLAFRPIEQFGLAPFGTGPKSNDNAVINALSAKWGIPGIGHKGDQTLNYPENYGPGPNVPDIAETPDIPKKPETPKTPQTPHSGKKMNYAALALIGLGGGLLMGWIIDG